MKVNNYQVWIFCGVILILILILILFFNGKSDKEKYIKPEFLRRPSINPLTNELITFEEGGDVFLYSILRDHMSISDLIQLSKVNQDTLNYVQKLIRKIFGYERLRELQNLKFFYSEYPEQVQTIKTLYKIFAILGAKVLKLMSYTSPFNNRDYIFLLVDYSNLNVLFVPILQQNNPVYGYQDEDILVRIYSAMPEPDRRHLLKISINLSNGNLNSANRVMRIPELRRLVQSLTPIPFVNQDGMFPQIFPQGLNPEIIYGNVSESSDLTKFDFYLRFSEEDKENSLNHDLNKIFNNQQLRDFFNPTFLESEIEEEKEREEKVENIEDEKKIGIDNTPPTEENIILLLTRIQNVPQNVINRFLNDIIDSDIKRIMKDVISSLRNQNYSRYPETFNMNARYELTRSRKITRDVLDKLLQLLNDIEMEMIYDAGDEFGFPQPPLGAAVDGFGQPQLGGFQPLPPWR